MLSREADACYWIGRCVERAEATARMVDVHYHAALETFLPMALDEDRAGSANEISPIQWRSALAISGNLVGFGLTYDTITDRDVLDYFGFAPDNPNSILSVWKTARENARSIRDQISSEMWESLNASYLKLRDWNVERVLAGGPHEFFQTVRDYSHLFQGILNRTLMMGEARDWIDVGRFLERADQTSRLLDMKHYDEIFGLPAAEARSFSQEGTDGDEELLLDPFNIHSWIAVLKSACAFEMYRKTYRDGIKPEHIVDFLALNAKFPASIRHCIDRVSGCLGRIAPASGELRSEPERMLGRLRADLTYMRAEEILNAGLHETLADLQERCSQISNAITRAYLSY